jgi:hypothetical protein
VRCGIAQPSAEMGLGDAGKRGKETAGQALPVLQHEDLLFSGFFHHGGPNSTFLKMEQWRFWGRSWHQTVDPESKRRTLHLDVERADVGAMRLSNRQMQRVSSPDIDVFTTGNRGGTAKIRRCNRENLEIEPQIIFEKILGAVALLDRHLTCSPFERQRRVKFGYIPFTTCEIFRTQVSKPLLHLHRPCLGGMQTNENRGIEVEHQ